MDRPYFEATIKELEVLLKKHTSQRVVLAQLREELAFRKTHRAKQLLHEIEGLLSGAVPPANRPKAAKPQDQLRLMKD
jgi:hypothetical protein